MWEYPPVDTFRDMFTRYVRMAPGRGTTDTTALIFPDARGIARDEGVFS